MFALTVVLAAVLAAAFTLTGAGKLAGVPKLAEARTHLDVEPTLWKLIGVLEVVGAAGLLIGLAPDLPFIGVLAATGFVFLTVGATYYHQRAGDRFADWLPAVFMGSLAIFYVILRVGTA